MPVRQRYWKRNENSQRTLCEVKLPNTVNGHRDSAYSDLEEAHGQDQKEVPLISQVLAWERESAGGFQN